MGEYGRHDPDTVTIPAPDELASLLHIRDLYRQQESEGVVVETVLHSNPYGGWEEVAKLADVSYDEADDWTSCKVRLTRIPDADQ